MSVFQLRRVDVYGAICSYYSFDCGYNISFRLVILVNNLYGIVSAEAADVAVLRP